MSALKEEKETKGKGGKNPGQKYKQKVGQTYSLIAQVRRPVNPSGSLRSTIVFTKGIECGMLWLRFRALMLIWVPLYIAISLLTLSWYCETSSYYNLSTKTHAVH
jgi:hypothetical protein